MNKIKSKVKSKAHISPGQLRDALIVTGREYRETPEYKEKAEQQLTTILEQITPKIKQFQDFAKQINQRIESSKLPQTMKYLQEQYSYILENSQPKKIFISPRVNDTPNFLPPEVVEEISQKSAEKVIERFKTTFQQSPPTETKKCSIKLPPKTIWEDIEIRFKNMFDVEIYCKGKFLKNSNYEELGFLRENTKDKKPDRQWELLRLLAIIYNSKKITKVNAKIDILAHSLKTEKNACMKIKEGLSKKLQKAFGLTQNPFHDYKEVEEYQTWFTLKPEPEMRGNGEIFTTKTKYDDNKNYLDQE